MSIPAPTVASAVAALMSQIATQVATDTPPSGEPILLILGEPTTYEPVDIIQIAPAIVRTVTPENLMGNYGTTALKESYEIEYQVSTWSGDPDPLAPFNRAYQLLGYVETAVRTDPSLGSTILEAHPPRSSGGDPEWSEDPVGRLVTLNGTIAVQTLN